MIEQLETIAAISTPAGEGAIALVRISGENTLELADKIFRGQEKPSQFPSHTQRFGEVFRGDRTIDQVMLTVHRTPSSYTGEDLIEISCHGGILVSARVLEVCLQAGARAARPGEFTERAYLNGKMDLTQAEAVIDLIRAQSDLALRSATEQLEGRLGAQMNSIRRELTEILAHIDASIDFPEEGIEPDEGEKLRARLDAIRTHLADLLATSEHGRILREGLRVVIYGATNAGKSSLLNRLLGFERAIVSEIPGTTRDTIEEMISLRGVPLRLLDTAGIRDSKDELERAGMLRTAKSLEAADLVLHIVDSTAPRPPQFHDRKNERPEILLLNKSDLAEHSDWKNCEALRISCVREDGLRGLEERILETIGMQKLRAESALAINTRHRDCLRRALAACDEATATIEKNFSVEYVSLDLGIAHRAITEVVGGADTEEIRNAIFSQFCIGK